MITCCFKGCRAKRVKGTTLTFHKFPLNNRRCFLWLQNIGRENFFPTRTPNLCSQHFEVECFDVGKAGGPFLKSTAIPTIFNFANKTTKSSPDNDISLRQEKTSNLVEAPSINEVSTIDDDNDDSIDEALDSNNEITLDKGKKESVTYINNDIRLGLEKADKLIKRQHKTIRCLKSKNSCLRKKVEKLKSVIEEYKNRVYIPPELIKEVLRMNPELIVKPTVNVPSSAVNESCDSSLPNSTVTPTVNVPSFKVNESFDNSVPNSIVTPTVNVPTSPVNESCDYSVPNSSVTPPLNMPTFAENENCINLVPNS